ncbi:MAG: FAD-dependent oxidoreductase, partial [Treponema sp.]|nr:FAD-dependent oxidoreductase [Treponema sp.]
MKRYELIVIGAGPAGLSAGIEAAKNGMKVVVFDENARPGGQLFKQIHKFFGSKEHHAKERGFKIGEALLQEARDAGVEVYLDSTVMGIYQNHEVTVKQNGNVNHFKADYIIIATGAAENMIPFKGWNKPGVIGAGAAQALMNLQGVQPGSKILMVGSGNVGLVVSFQLLQAGCEVAAVIDAAPRVGGYGVHAAKVARTGVPFYMKHTVIEAKGTDRVTSAVIAEVDDHFKPIPGTEKELDVDTICIAVGLSPMSQLASNATCNMALLPQKG